MKKTYITPATTTLSLSMEQMIAQSLYTVDPNRFTDSNWSREKGFASGWNYQLWSVKEEDRQDQE